MYVYVNDLPCFHSSICVGNSQFDLMFHRLSHKKVYLKHVKVDHISKNSETKKEISRQIYCFVEKISKRNFQSILSIFFNIYILS